MIIHWFLHFLGIEPRTASTAYNWWSGAGSDIAELAMVGGIAAVVRKHNCHVHRCWRIGRHAVSGTPHIVCRKHHPVHAEVPLTVEQIHAEHEAANA